MQKVLSIILIYKPTYKVVGLARETLLLSLIRPLPITYYYIYTYMYAYMYTIPDSQGWAPQWLCNLGGLGVSEQALGGIPLGSGIVDPFSSKLTRMGLVNTSNTQLLLPK